MVHLNEKPNPQLCWNDIKWIYETGIDDIDSIDVALKYRIYRKLSQLI